MHFSMCHLWYIRLLAVCFQHAYYSRVETARAASSCTCSSNSRPMVPSLLKWSVCRCTRSHLCFSWGPLPGIGDCHLFMPQNAPPISRWSIWPATLKLFLRRTCRCQLYQYSMRSLALRHRTVWFWFLCAEERRNQLTTNVYVLALYLYLQQMHKISLRSGSFVSRDECATRRTSWCFFVVYNKLTVQ